MRLYTKKPVINKALTLDPDGSVRKEAVMKLFASQGIEYNEKERNIVSYSYDEPVKEKTVLLLGLGKNVRGNMQYILDVLNKSPDFKGYKCFVRTDDETDDTVKGFIEKNGWKRTKTVKSDRHYGKLLETCNYLVTETFFPESWVKREGQVYINTWHGTPLKKLGLAKNTKNIPGNSNTQKNFVNADYLLYPNNYTYKNMVESYKVRELLTGKALMLGYPRCGGLIKEAAKDNTELRASLAPDGQRLFVYMPTFKDYRPNEEVVEESKALLDYLDANLSDDQILYVNLHHRLSDVIDYSVFTHIKKFPPLVDSYALMAVSDALITDFSSVFFDYLTLGKQIILHIEDYKHYKKARGTYMNMLSLPFDMARSGEEIIECLNKGGKTYDDTKSRAKYCAYDSAENAEKLCQLFLGNEEGLKLKGFAKEGKRKALAVTDGCPGTNEFARLKALFETAELKNTELYISTNKLLTGKDENAYPFLFNNPAFCYTGNVKLSYEGEIARQLYDEGKISFDEAFEVLKYDYLASAKAMYGNAEFDSVLIYDVSDIDILLSVAMMTAKRKSLYVSNALIEKILSNDKLTLDAISAAAPYLDGIYAYKPSVSDRLGECMDVNADNARWLKNVDSLSSSCDIAQTLLTDFDNGVNVTAQKFVLRYFSKSLNGALKIDNPDKKLRCDVLDSGSVEYSFGKKQVKNDGTAVLEAPRFTAGRRKALGYNVRVKVCGEWLWIMEDGSLAVNDAKGGRKPSTKIKKMLAVKKFRAAKKLFLPGDTLPVIELAGLTGVIAETQWK